MSALTDELYERLRAHLPNAGTLSLPPPCFDDMQAEVMTLELPDRLGVRFPVLTRYRNPLGFMQGGFIAAALDNTIGPFSYLVAPPSVTTHLQLSYLRPVPPSLAHIDCEARLLERAGRTAVYQGQVLDPDGRVLVLAQATTQLV